MSVSEIDLTRFSSGGYFLIRANTPPWRRYDETIAAAQYPRVEKLPEKVVSLSGCICPKFSVHWSWIPESPESAEEFGIPSTDYERYKQWCTDSLHAPKVNGCFKSPDNARACIQELNLDTKDLWLVGIGFPNSILEDDEVEAVAEPADDINGNLKRRLLLDSSGSFIGYDFVYQWLSHEFDCSWMCHSYTFEPIHDDPAVTFNALGLLADEASAKRAYEIQPNKPGDVEHFEYWLMLSYNVEG